MSVLVKGMKMPNGCGNCEFSVCEDISFELVTYCLMTRGYVNPYDLHSRPYDCPLVKIPEHHGRLIDADELNFSMTDSIDQGIAEEVRDNAPTIIEAE